MFFQARYQNRFFEPPGDILGSNVGFFTNFGTSRDPKAAIWATIWAKKPPKALTFSSGKRPGTDLAAIWGRNLSKGPKSLPKWTKSRPKWPKNHPQINEKPNKYQQKDNEILNNQSKINQKPTNNAPKVNQKCTKNAPKAIPGRSWEQTLKKHQKLSQKERLSGSIWRAFGL